MSGRSGSTACVCRSTWPSGSAASRDASGAVRGGTDMGLHSFTLGSLMHRTLSSWQHRRRRVTGGRDRVAAQRPGLRADQSLSRRTGQAARRGSRARVRRRPPSRPRRGDTAPLRATTGGTAASRDSPTRHDVGRDGRGGDVLAVGRFGRRLRRRGEPGGDRAAPLRDLGGRRSAAVIAVRRQDRQVVDEEHPAARGTVAQPAPDRREVALELREALIGRVRIPEPGDAGPDPGSPAAARAGWPG